MVHLTFVIEAAHDVNGVFLPISVLVDLHLRVTLGCIMIHDLTRLLSNFIVLLDACLDSVMLDANDGGLQSPPCKLVYQGSCTHMTINCVVN